jgi:putative oxidoreductase
MNAKLDWLTLFTRVIAGLLFGMAGYDKVFRLTPIGHATQYFTGPYADSWIPYWLLLAAGWSIPFVELVGGWSLVIGWCRRPAAVALGVVLVLMTYGHGLRESLFDVTTHILPRVLLLTPAWVFGVQHDPWSVDGLLAWRRARRMGG